jgi:hypothetical protein
MSKANGGNGQGQQGQDQASGGVGAPPSTPAAGTPPVPPAPPKEGKKRVKCEALKGGKVIVGKGEPVQIDENGFFEVDEKQAARLLSIPGYKEA